MITLELNKDLMWQSDWDGEEVGFENVNVVGLYSLAANPSINFYIDMETMKILEVWIGEEE